MAQTMTRNWVMPMDSPGCRRSYGSIASGVLARRVTGERGLCVGTGGRAGRVEGGDVLAPQGHRVRLGTIVLAASLQFDFKIPTSSCSNWPCPPGSPRCVLSPSAQAPPHQSMAKIGIRTLAAKKPIGVPLWKPIGFQRLMTHAYAASAGRCR